REAALHESMRENEIFRISLNRATGQAGPPTQALNELASRHATHSIEAILKKAYREQEMGDLDEGTAVNSLGLVLKMGGEFTYAHSARVLEYSMELADELGVTDQETRKQIKYGAMLKDIGEMGVLLGKESDQKLEKMGDFLGGQDMIRAGLLHDIGKVRIPPEILYKPGRLTEEEYNIMKMHPIYGEQILYPIASLRHLCPAVRGHHERWDGKGYPDGLKEEEIPYPARIIAVADVFDALAAARPYKPGMEIEKVRGILLEGRGTHFDPELLDGFMRVLDRRYPELARKRARRSREEGNESVTPG
ncbi:HD-GYP domain-containing protein, partial [bacterium CPR1]|nr:HD-GYP domain-containing protein [bacterium CPR1]